jgi:hypothetical protein
MRARCNEWACLSVFIRALKADIGRGAGDAGEGGAGGGGGGVIPCLDPYRRIMNDSGWIGKCGGEMKVKLGVLVLFCCEFIWVFS